MRTQTFSICAGPGVVRAFTLVEMLVVIAITGVLIAMLLPSLAASRNVSQAQVCANNLRQQGLGFVYYAQDFQDRIPPVGTSSFNLFDATRGVTNLGGAFYHYIGKQGYWGVSQVRTDAGISVTNTRWAVMQCPSETGSRTDPAMTNRTYYSWGRVYSSFAMNWSVSRYAYYVGYGGLTDVFRIGWQRGSPLVKPWEASIVYDCPEMGSGWALPYAEWNQDTMTTPYFDPTGTTATSYGYAFRHNNMTRNALFMDGRVTYQRHRAFTGVSLYQNLWNNNPPSTL